MLIKNKNGIVSLYRRKSVNSTDKVSTLQINCQLYRKSVNSTDKVYNIDSLSVIWCLIIWYRCLIIFPSGNGCQSISQYNGANFLICPDSFLFRTLLQFLQLQTMHYSSRIPSDVHYKYPHIIYTQHIKRATILYPLLLKRWLIFNQLSGNE